MSRKYGKNVIFSSILLLASFACVPTRCLSISKINRDEYYDDIYSGEDSSDFSEVIGDENGDYGRKVLLRRRRSLPYKCEIQLPNLNPKYIDSFCGKLILSNKRQQWDCYPIGRRNNGVFRYVFAKSNPYYPTKRVVLYNSGLNVGAKLVSKTQLKDIITGKAKQYVFVHSRDAAINGDVLKSDLSGKYLGLTKTAPRRYRFVMKNKNSAAVEVNLLTSGY